MQQEFSLPHEGTSCVCNKEIAQLIMMMMKSLPKACLVWRKCKRGFLKEILCVIYYFTKIQWWIFESKKFILQVDLLDKIYNYSKFVRFVICSLLWVWIQNKYTRKESGEILGFLLNLFLVKESIFVFFSFLAMNPKNLRISHSLKESQFPLISH